MNHLRDRVPHMADGLCQYVHQYNNKVLICKVRPPPASVAELGPRSKCDVVYVVPQNNNAPYGIFSILLSMFFMSLLTL